MFIVFNSILILFLIYRRYQDYFFLDIESFPLVSGWALQSNQKYGKKGSEKRMMATVKAYLERYFLVGNVNKTDRISAKDMVTQLQHLASEDGIQSDDVSEIKMVEGDIRQV